MGFVSEFKEFIAKGNVLDLAVGVIIGAAFGKIVTSLTDDIIMPVIGLALGKVDFTNLWAGRWSECAAKCRRRESRVSQARRGRSLPVGV